MVPTESLEEGNFKDKKYLNLHWYGITEEPLQGVVNILDDGKWIGCMQGAFEGGESSEARKVILGIEESGILKLCVFEKISEDYNLFVCYAAKNKKSYFGKALRLDWEKKYLSFIRNVPEILESFFLSENNMFDTLSKIPRERLEKGFCESLGGDDYLYSLVEGCLPCSLTLKDSK